MPALLVVPLWLSVFMLLVNNKRFQDWRDPFLIACTIWGVAVTALTETLSLFSLLSFWPVAAAWLLLSLASAVVLRRFSGATMNIRGRSFLPKSRGLSGWIFLGGIGAILLSTACVALVSPPNNFDSMTYHLMKVVNWMDHRSVRHYPTHIPYQVYLGPWAEFAILQLQILSGGDRFAACVQYISMLGSVIAVSRIASKLGATRHTQLFASVCCATIPLGILEASSTQNDLVTAFWFVCFLNSALDLVNGTITWQSATLAGASLGLVALTKTTGLLFAAPFLVWIGFSMYRRSGTRGMTVPIWILFCTTVLTAPHLYRNWSTFGSFLEPPDELVTHRNQAYSPAAIASNIVRDIAVHASGLPRGWGVVVRAVERFHRFIGEDFYDPRTTTTGLYGERVHRQHFQLGQALYEDTAGNPLHVLLGSLAFVICLWSPRHRIYALCLCAGFVLLCVLIKWDWWVVRYQLPLFVAIAPIIAIAFGFPGLRRSMPSVGIVLVLLGLIPATMNLTRPLISHSSILFRDRKSLYFENLPNLQGPYLAAAAELSKTPFSRVGVICGNNSPEYPLRWLVRQAAPRLQFEYVDVTNSSKRAVSSKQPPIVWPDTIVTIERPDVDDLLAQRGMHPALISGAVKIYRSAQGAATSTGQ
jgi:hypothetical protein